MLLCQSSNNHTVEGLLASTALHSKVGTRKARGLRDNILAAKRSTRDTRNIRFQQRPLTQHGETFGWPRSSCREIAYGVQATKSARDWADGKMKHSEVIQGNINEVASLTGSLNKLSLEAYTQPAPKAY